MVRIEVPTIDNDITDVTYQTINTGKSEVHINLNSTQDNEIDYIFFSIPELEEILKQAKRYQILGVTNEI